MAKERLPMKEKETKPKRGRPSTGKYDAIIHIDATPEEVARSLFRGKPKSLAEWKPERKISPR